MADHAEEQEMECEALTAIFDTAFEILSDVAPFQWSVSIYPEAGDPVELDALNHVACKLLATLPTDYPEGLPELHVEIIKGLAPDHQDTLTALAMEEAVANEGVACIFAVAERLREWLAENNVKGLDDVSMHAQMMRKQKDEEKASKRAQAAFESQKEKEEFSIAELEENAHNKRRADGTPCTNETFLQWKLKFDQEMANRQDDQENDDVAGAGGKAMKKKTKEEDEKAARLSGFEHFNDKTNNLEAIEAAAAQAELEENAEEELEDVNEELFFDDDDDDLDDLDFASSDEEEDLDI